MIPLLFRQMHKGGGTMADKKNLDVVLEKVGNQPLKTTKVLCGALGLGLAAAKGMTVKITR